VKRKTEFKSVLLYLSGLALSCIPVIIATLSYFPLWKSEGGGRVVSGGVLLLCLLAIVPLIRTVKRLIASPAAHTLWFIIFVLFFALSKIADEMTVIAFVGFVSNLLGALLFKLSGLKKVRGNDNEQGA
jgi:hypothetical protein